MTSNTNPLGLYTPQQTLSKGDSPYLNPREAEKWLANLPVAAVGETARLVYKALAEMNRTTLDVATRFKLLEMFREPVDYVGHALKKHYIGQPFPLSPKTQKIAELGQELQWEMANGYKILIEHSLSSLENRVDSKLLLQAIHRAVFYLGQTLLKAFQVYSPAPPHVWIELHHLYMFAEHNTMQEKIIKDPVRKWASANSICRLYKQILLHALSNPYRMPQVEIEKVYDALDEWSGHCEILMLEDVQRPPGLFSVDLSKDAAPSYFVPSKIETVSLVRILSTGELTRIVRNRVVDADMNRNEETASFFVDDELHQDTLRRLILAWGAVPKRNFSRIGKNTPVKTTLGLNATHFFVSQDPVDKETDKLYQFDSEALEPLTDADADISNVHYLSKATFSAVPAHRIGESSKQPDVWDIASNPNLNGESEFTLPSTNNMNGYFTQFDSEEKQPAEANLGSDSAYESYNCKLTNESVGGCRIEWGNCAPTKTVVGSLIGIKHTDTDAKKGWSIGVTRWMKNLGERQMELGIELLAPNARAVATRNITRKTKLGDHMRSLLLPELRAINQPQTLVTPPTYMVGDKLEIRFNNCRCKVRLTKLMERTNTFNQFQFMVLKTTKIQPETGKLDRIKNFDSIWSSI